MYYKSQKSASMLGHLVDKPMSAYYLTPSESADIFVQ